MAVIFTCDKCNAVLTESRMGWSVYGPHPKMYDADLCNTCSAQFEVLLENFMPNKRRSSPKSQEKL